MRKICVMNHKGGVGKTTTAINLAAGLSRQDRKVLLVDLDPQGNVDVSLRLQATADIYDAMTGNLPVQQCITSIGHNLDIISSRENLTKAEYYLATNEDKRFLVKELLDEIDGYDYVIIDCPPSLGLLNQNAMVYCDEAYVPTSTDFLGMDALLKMTRIIQTLNQAYEHKLRITKIIPTLHDKRNKICKETLADMQETFPELVTTPIRINSKLKEAPREGQSIFSYDKASNGAKDYGKLVEDTVMMEAMVAFGPDAY